MNYRRAFIIAIVISVVLAVTLLAVWTRSRQTTAAQPGETPVVASGPPVPAAAPASATAEPNLQPVQISPQRLQAIGIRTAEVRLMDVHGDIRAPGSVEANEQNLAYVQTRFSGWIRKVFANATYRYVRRGQPLFTIYSPELVSTEQEYLLARDNWQRGTAKNDSGATQANWLLQASSDRLSQFGIPASEIARLQATGKVQHAIVVDSPVAGYITERNALPNQYVQPETRLYTITDLSTVWVYAAVFQNDIGSARPGSRATVTVDAYPGAKFAGRVDSILPQVDASTRTVKVRLVFANPGLKLKPGMFVNVQLSVPLGRQLVVPTSGVLQSGTHNIAFVDHGQGYLEPREVELGARLEDKFVVMKGLRAGERIVSSANFLVDAESQLQAALGSFAPPPPGAGAAAAMNTSAPQASVDLTTDPSPPHKGANTLQVKLTAADGRPITGAHVTVTFFMPAMPAMGMAAMRIATDPAEKGNGIYEGRNELPSGGTWQVTISAQQNGKTIASKQLNLSSTGGM